MGLKKSMSMSCTPGERKQKIFEDVLRKNTFTSLKFSKYLISREILLLNNQWSLRTNYCNQRVSF